MKKNSSTLFLSHLTWWAETDEHFWGATLFFSSMILSSFSKRSIWKTLVWIYRFPWSVLFLKFSGCIIWKRDWFVFFVPRFLGLMKLINTVFALRYVWSDFSDKHLWSVRLAFSSGILLIFSKGSSWITFSSSSPLSRLLIRVSFFVLISGKSDWFNDFCDLFMCERNSSTQFYRTSPGGQKLTSIFEVVIYYFHSWSFRASQNDWFENLVWLKARLVCLFVLFSWIDESHQYLFCTSVTLVRFFWLASLKC